MNMFGVLMVHCGDADGMVSGAIHTTAATVRPAMQVRLVPPSALGFGLVGATPSPHAAPAHPLFPPTVAPASAPLLPPPPLCRSCCACVLAWRVQVAAARLAAHWGE